MARKIEPFPGTMEMQYVDRPYITKTGRNGCQRVKAWVLSDAQRDWLCRWFPEVENDVLMRASGMSHSTLHRFARLYGLEKSEAGLHGIMKRQGKKTKRTCERNGYYDSIRGKPPSDECRKGAARMWQDIREGRREHPAVAMRRENPRKYRRWMRRRSEERKATIRKEKMRVVYGLERKTRLKAVVITKYTRSQVAHRYNALRRGYVLAADCSERGGYRYNVYFDADTRRSDAFERNLIRDGFTVLEWTFD